MGECDCSIIDYTEKQKKKIKGIKHSQNQNSLNFPKKKEKKILLLPFMLEFLIKYLHSGWGGGRIHL